MTNNTNVTIEKTRKLVVVGDGMCGKTCLLYAFMHKTFDPLHTPTIFDTYATKIQVDAKKVSQYRLISQHELERFFLLIDHFGTF
jgi:GTPase SAR1 family protein